MRPSRRNQSSAAARCRGPDGSRGRENRRGGRVHVRSRLLRSPARFLHAAAFSARASSIPRMVSQQSNGEGTAPVAFCRNLIGSNTAGFLGERGALNRVGMSCEILRHAVHHDVRAQFERLLKTGSRERIVHDHQRPISQARLAVDLGALSGMSQLADRCDVADQQARVCRRSRSRPAGFAPKERLPRPSSRRYQSAW